MTEGNATYCATQYTVTEYNVCNITRRSVTWQCTRIYYCNSIVYGLPEWTLLHLYSGCKTVSWTLISRIHIQHVLRSPHRPSVCKHVCIIQSTLRLSAILLIIFNGHTLQSCCGLLLSSVSTCWKLKNYLIHAVNLWFLMIVDFKVLFETFEVEHNQFTLVFRAGND